MKGFCQQAFDITTSILDTMESTLNMFTDAAQEAVKFGWIWEGLISPFSRPDAVASLLTHLGLPFVTNEPLVPENVAIFDVLQETLSCIAFIHVGAHQIVKHWQAIQGGQHDQFVAKVVHFARRTMSIGSTPGKIAMRLTAFVAHDWNGLCIHQQTFGVGYPKQGQPGAPQHLDQITQAASASGVLALVYQLRKLAPIIRPYIANILRSPWIRNAILLNLQPHHPPVPHVHLSPSSPP